MGVAIIFLPHIISYSKTDLRLFLINEFIERIYLNPRNVKTKVKKGRSGKRLKVEYSHLAHYMHFTKENIKWWSVYGITFILIRLI